MVVIKFENNKRKNTSHFPYVRISCFVGQFNKTASEMIGYARRCDVFAEKNKKKITIKFNDEGDYSICKRPGCNSLRMCMEQVVTTLNIDKSEPYEIFKEENGIYFYYKERGDVN